MVTSPKNEHYNFTDFKRVLYYKDNTYRPLDIMLIPFINTFCIFFHYCNLKNFSVDLKKYGKTLI